MKYKNVAIVIHPLTTWGGAEYNLQVLAGMFHNPTIYTAWSDKDFLEQRFPNNKVVNSFLTKIPLKGNSRKILIPFLPMAYRTFDFQGHDLIIVVSDGFEKFVERPPNCDLIHYVLTPARFLWLGKGSYTSSNLSFKIYRKLLKEKLHEKWKESDKQFARKADLTIAISKEVQARIAKYYGVDSHVVYPPVEINKVKYNRFIEKREEWYLYLGRVETYKGVELAIKACISSGKKLKVAGKGGDLERMKTMVDSLKARHLVGFLGFVSDEMKRELLYNCKALLYPVDNEDFGIVPVEANASGCPVVGYRSGGVIETIVDRKTGVLFNDLTVDSLIAAMDDLEKISFSPDRSREQASKFSRDRFENKMLTEINGLSKR